MTSPMDADLPSAIDDICGLDHLTPSPMPAVGAGNVSPLPEDVVEHIFMHLSPYGDLQNCRLVSRLWKRLAEGALAKMRRSLLQCSAFDWFLLMQQATSSTKPYNSAVTERCSHSACYYKASGSVFVFGGCTAAYTTFNDLWRFDLALRIWTRPMPAGSYPTPKACATLVEFKGTLLLFGGWSKSSPNPIHQTAMFYNELHVYDVRQNFWTQMHADGQAPHLAGHSASVVQGFMVIFGGSHGSGSSNVVFVYDIRSLRWFSPKTSSPKPAPRYGQSQILIDECHLLIFGGCGGPNLILSDVWLLTMDWGPSGVEWLWEELAVLNPHLGAPLLWSHPACKVGTKAVVLSKSQRGAHAARGSSYRSMSMSPRLGTGDPGTSRPDRPGNGGAPLNRTTTGWVPPQGNLIPPRQRRLISSRSLDEQNGPGSSQGRSPGGGGVADASDAGGCSTSSANVGCATLPGCHGTELQRARSIPAIIVGEIPQLVVTEDAAAMELDQQHVAPAPRHSPIAAPSSSSQCIAMAASSLLPYAATAVEPPPALAPNVEMGGGKVPCRSPRCAPITAISSMTSSAPAARNISAGERHAEALRRMNEFINARMSHQREAPGFSGDSSKPCPVGHPEDAAAAPGCSSARLKFRPSSPPPQNPRRQSAGGFFRTPGNLGTAPNGENLHCGGYGSPPKNPMSVYVLDCAYVLTAKTVSWSILEDNWDAPEDTILYSLVQGCGELVLFGGMRSQAPKDCHGLDVTPSSHTITNETYILRPPVKF